MNMNTTAQPHPYHAANGQAMPSGNEYRQPVMPIKFEQCCPACQAAQNANPNILSRLKGAFFQLLGALFVIVLSILRLARLIVAGAFTLVGLIGTGIYIAGQNIVHPDDQRLLPNLPKTHRD